MLRLRENAGGGWLGGRMAGMFGRSPESGPPSLALLCGGSPPVRSLARPFQIIQAGGYNGNMKMRWATVLSAVFDVSLDNGLTAQENTGGAVRPVARPPALGRRRPSFPRPGGRRRNHPRRFFSRCVRNPLPVRLFLDQDRSRDRSGGARRRAGRKGGGAPGPERSGVYDGPAELSAGITDVWGGWRQEGRCGSGS